jgi:UDP-glucose 4-epimerase
MINIITGGAGFIGSNLTKKILDNGGRVVILDNFSKSTIQNIEPFISNANFSFVKVNLNILHEYKEAIREINDIHAIWHLAANSDIMAGLNDPRIDLENTFMTTFNTLEIVKMKKIKELFFASSSAIYGDHGDQVITEDTGGSLPISNYGAMKLSSESLISAAVESYPNLERTYIFRFPNVIGSPATHGLIYDLICKLCETPELLSVLGDGTQSKSYLHVSDLIDAMFHIKNTQKNKLNIYNIGNTESLASVKSIAEKVVSIVSPNAVIVYGNENRGWIGDVPRVNLNSKKLYSIGWLPKLSSNQAITKAIYEIARKEDLS